MGSGNYAVFDGAGSSALPVSSPVMSSQFGLYNNWGGANGRVVALPRNSSTFTQGNFAPLTPIYPVPLDYPNPATGRPTPRRFVYPPGWNIPVGVPGSEGLKLASFQFLRYHADINPLVRACVEVRKKEVIGLGWDIVPTKEAEAGMDKADRKDWQERRKIALDFFSNPDPDIYPSFTSWFNALLEEIFVPDALSIYLKPTDNPNDGPFGSGIERLALLDGTLIRPLLSLDGTPPKPPEPAFQEYYYGVPRVDLMIADLNNRPVSNNDLKDYEETNQYRADELFYLPFNKRSWTPYGFPPLERVLMAAMTYQKWLETAMLYYEEGSMPGTWVIAPPEFTADQRTELQDALNSYAGDVAWKNKQIVVPHGTDFKQIKPLPIADQSTEVIEMTIAMGFEVQPMEIGILPKVSASVSPGQANQIAKASADVSQRKALKPFLEQLQEDLFNPLLQGKFKQTDMRWLFNGVEAVEDEASRVELWKNKVSFALATIDEARTAFGEEAYGLPETENPGILTSTGIVPLTQATDSSQLDPNAQAAAAAAGLNPTGQTEVDHTSPTENSPLTDAKNEADTNDTPAKLERLDLIKTSGEFFRQADQIRAKLRHGKSIKDFH